MQRVIQKSKENAEAFKRDVVQLVAESTNKEDLLSSISSLKIPSLEKGDFLPRRTRADVADDERCAGVCANGLRCSRSRKGGHVCGIHRNIIRQTAQDSVVKKEVSPLLIKGIPYYVCSEGNVYDPEDVKKKLPNPRIIGNVRMEGEIPFFSPHNI